MNCKNCNNDLPIDAKFCNKCGKAAEYSKLDKINNHLEFLGYTVEFIKASEDGGKDLYAARHSQHNSLIFLEIMPDFILFRVNLITKKKPSPEIYEYINNANSQLLGFKVYSEIEEGLIVLRFDCVYPGHYNKEIFGQFINILNNDVQNFYKSNENFNRIFLDI